MSSTGRKLNYITGSIVRTAPNELSFNTAQSWKDIYDFRPGHKTFIKSNFYDGGSFADRCGSIVSERDPKKHEIMRKYLSHSFSHRSLTEQEYLVSKNVDNFIDKIGQIGSRGTDIALELTLMSFDIIGDLAFGENFKGTESGNPYPTQVVKLDCVSDTCELDTVHPWISRMTGAMTQGAVADCFKRFPMLAKAAMAIMSGTIMRVIHDTKINEDYSIDVVTK